MVGLVWLFTTKTNIGSNIVAAETRWSQTQWVRVLLVIVISMFILVNPLFHLLAVAVIGGLYYLLVSEKEFGKNVFGFNERGPTTSSTSTISASKSTVILTCKALDDTNTLDSKEKLQRCLFSFPYIKEQPNPVIQYVEGNYEVDLSISDITYKTSLMEYICQSGFEVEIKK